MPRPVSCGPLTQRKRYVTMLALRFARGAAVMSPPAAAAFDGAADLGDGWLMAFLCGIKRQGGSHRSHNENDSHLNIVIKENLKRSNDAELIKASCDDERGCRWDGMLFPSTQTHRQGPAIRIPISYPIRWVCNDALY